MHSCCRLTVCRSCMSVFGRCRQAHPLSSCISMSSTLSFTRFTICSLLSLEYVCVFTSAVFSGRYVYASAHPVDGVGGIFLGWPSACACVHMYVYTYVGAQAEAFLTSLLSTSIFVPVCLSTCLSVSRITKEIMGELSGSFG